MSKRGEINPLLGVTDAQLRTQIRSALRKCWRNSSRRVFIESVRVPYVGSGRFKYGVVCVHCKRMMGQSEKEFQTLANGKRSKRKSSAYQVDHIAGCPSFTDIVWQLGNYCYSLMYGKLQILCTKCHKKETLKGKD